MDTVDDQGSSQLMTGLRQRSMVAACGQHRKSHHSSDAGPPSVPGAVRDLSRWKRVEVGDSARG